MLNKLHRFFFSENIFNIDVQVKSKIKKHLSKVHFRVISRYKRFFQLKNRFLAVNLRTLFLRISRKWGFRDFFFFKKLNIYKFKFFSYKLALILKQLLKYFYICNEKTFKRNILDKFINFSNRLDLVCIRVHFFKTILEARLGITHGLVHVNGASITYWNFYLKKYDFVTLHTPAVYAFSKTREFIARVKRLYAYHWRLPVCLRSVNIVFNFINQIRLFICEVFLLSNFYFFVTDLNLIRFFNIAIRCFNIFKYWVRFLRLLIQALPRAYILCLYYLRKFFKRKLINFIQIARERRKKFLKKKFYAGMKRFKGRRGYRGFFYRLKDSIKAKAAKLPYTFKRVDKKLRVTRYASFFSKFLVFFFMSAQFFSIRYRKKIFDILGKTLVFCFARIQFYIYLVLKVPYFAFLGVLQVIRLGACFVYFNYRTIVDSAYRLNTAFVSPKRRRIFIRIFKKIGSNRIVKSKKIRINKIFTRISQVVLAFGRCFKFHFLFGYLCFARFLKAFSNLYLYIRLYVKLYRSIHRHKLRYSFKRNTQQHMIKRRFRVYISKRHRRLKRYRRFLYNRNVKRCASPFRIFGITKQCPIFFFNLFLYFNCIDFDIVDISLFSVMFRDLLHILFSKFDLKCNLMLSLQHFLKLDSSSYSLFFLFFNVDNLFRFLFLYFTMRRTIFAYNRTKSRRMRRMRRSRIFRRFTNHMKFRMFFLGYYFFDNYVVFWHISLLFKKFDLYLRQLERLAISLKYKFKRIFFLILSMLIYLFRLFGYYRRIRYMFSGGLKKGLGFCRLNLIYNKFFVCNWYISKLKYLIHSKYCFNFLKIKNLYMYSQDLYLYNCFKFFKKFTSFFKKSFKLFNLFIYMFLRLFNIRLNSVYRLRCFFFKNVLVFSTDCFYTFLISYCFKISQNIFETVLYFKGMSYLFNVVFGDYYNINIILFKFKFNLCFFLFKRLKLRFRVYIKKRYYSRLSPMFAYNTFVNKSWKRHFPVRWKILYPYSTSAAYKANKFNYLYMREFLCNYILRYHFKLRMHTSDYTNYRYIRKMKTNFFFSKSFLYYDIEYNTTAYPGFIYIGRSNSYVRRLQMRFNFFMNLILRFYAHSKSLVR